MSAREMERHDVIKRCVEEKLPRAKAAKILNISVRHVKRLISAYLKHRDKALISKRRSKPSNNKIAETIRDCAIQLVRKKYKDYSPTLNNASLIYKVVGGFSNIARFFKPEIKIISLIDSDRQYLKYLLENFVRTLRKLRIRLRSI